MTHSLKSIFQDLGSDLKVDARLIQQIHKFERGFVLGTPEHVEFFGGTTMGVHKMRFRTADRETWFEEVLRMDEMLVADAVTELPTIKEEWVRASDTMNLATSYLIYLLQTDTRYNQRERKEAAIQAAQVLLYKFLGSLMAHFYPYTADEATMNATYEALSKKFALKKAGSWAVLLRERAEELVSPRSVHRRVFERFDDDEAVIRMINDTQSRMRKIVKTMTAVFYEMRAKGARIESETNVLDINGETVLLDKTSRYNAYIRYIHQILDDRNSFVKKELLKVITDMMHTVPPKVLEDTLTWMSVNHRGKEGELIDKLSSETLIYAFDLIATNRTTLGGRNGLTPLLTRLRSLYMASRMADTTLLECKDLAEEIVTKAVSIRSTSTIASVRTSIQLYLVLRAMAMQHYQR